MRFKSLGPDPSLAIGFQRENIVYQARVFSGTDQCRM